MLKYILNTVLLLAITTFGFSQIYPTSSCYKDKDFLIKDVIFAGINNTGTGKSNYKDYTSHVANVSLGSTYTLSVRIKKKKHKYLTVWIDWNNDGDFIDSGERYVMASDVNGEHTYSKSITVPAGATIATTRMRVTVLKDSAPTSTGVQGDDGEVEDYSINITTPVIAGNREDLMYYVSDDDNKLYVIDVTTGNCELIGDNGVTHIEAIANWPAHLGNKLYAANGGDLVTLNTTTGAATFIGEIDGGGTANGAEGGQTLNDVDGLAFDARTGILWASNRRSSYDLMFQINVTTGKYVANAFGIGIDYIVIDGVGVNEDIDDISISPLTGDMYVVNNDGGSNDQILKINKSTGAVEVTTIFTSLGDVEGCDFASDGTFYVSEGSSTSTFNSVDISTGASISINNNLCGGGDVEALASLVQETNSMEGNVWEDTNEDGVKDAGETTGISNVEIKIYYDANGDGIINGSDEYLNTVKTDANGDWSFDYATTGHLIAKIDETTLPSGYALTSSSIQTANFTTHGSTDSNNDFGAINGSDCDGDGIPDFKEGSGDSDGDGIADQCDRDSDNDGILDSDESSIDTDGDGIADYLDLDSDNDGIPDALEANGGTTPSNYSNSGRITGSVDAWGLSTAVYTGGVSDLPNYDSDGDGAKDNRDLDSDNDGILDIIEAGGDDSDGNGSIDSYTDSNNDGYHDSFVNSPLPIYNNDIATETEVLPNYRDIDSDDDSIDDTREGYSPEAYTTITIIKDSDGDGILDLYDISSGGEPIIPHDFDGDGTPDYLDRDSDNDGGLDVVEGNDANGDGVADVSPSGIDNNKNGLDDAFDNACTGASSINITASSKNEQSVNDGYSYTGSSDIELVYDGEQQIIGIRFSGVNIDQGASINIANIQFVADSKTQSGALTLTIHGEDVNNASDVSGSDFDVSDRTQTSASVTWSPAPWTIDGEAGEAQKTTNIASIIQEIVNRPGWVSGNAIMIIIEGTSTTAYRHAEWDHGVPVLKIATSDGLQYNCGSNIAVNDLDNNGDKDFRDIGKTLPVSLINFTADKVDDYVDIKWTTASEINNDYFLVERSNDNKNYQEIDLIKGAGNSNVTLNYISIDFDLLQGVSYYRLKQVDYDGSTAYSNVIAIRNIAGEKIKIYPNPNTGQFVIDVNESVEVSIYTVTGQIVYNSIFEENSNNRVDLSNQKKGVYIITYSNNDEIITSKLIIK